MNAEVVLTPAKEGTDGAIRKAHEMLEAEPDNYFMPNQFENENNVLAHYETTGPEVFTQTNGEIPEVKVVGIEPPECHTIQGLKNMKESIVPKIYNPDMMDEKITVEDGKAFEMTRLLAAKEGIFVGMSSGAAVAGALSIAKQMTSGTIVVILPDRGDRYLSTTLFRSICAKCPP